MFEVNADEFVRRGGGGMVPSHKKGARDLVNNFRGVCVLSKSSKCWGEHL